MLTRLRSMAGLSAVLLAALAAFALVFSNARGSEYVARRAEVLQRSEAVLGAAAVARTAVAEALLLAEGERAGLVESADAEAARAGAHRALLELAGRLGELEAALDVTPDPVPDQMVESGLEVLSLVASDRLEEAGDIAGSAFEGHYLLLTTEAGAHREVAAADVAAARASAGRLVELSRFMVAFALPLLAFLGYRELLRRRVREAELETLLEAERDLSRAKDEFIANVSHELRTPLTSIYGFSRVLEEEGFDDPETALDLTNLIISESAELARMVDDLLAAARADAGVLSFQLEDVPADRELGDVVAPFNRSGPKIELETDSALVRVDPVRFRQVVRNLVSNARRHGGPRVRVEGMVEGDWFVCTVVDDGPGVRPDMEGRLFQRFTHQGRATVLAGGLGIGLSIARTLVEEMGGSIRYARKGEETTFVVRVPLARPAGETAADLLRQADGSRAASRNMHHLDASGRPLDPVEEADVVIDLSMAGEAIETASGERGES